MAQHRFVLADHAAVLLGVCTQTAIRRLARLEKGGYARHERVFDGQPALHLITRAGLGAVGSTLRTPRLEVHTYEHDVGVAWLWLAAHRGTFGPLSEVLAERTLRSHDGARQGESQPAEPLGVRLGRTGPHGREGLHYPDLLLTTADGRRVALELELSGKPRTKLESILAAYGADPRIAGVVYLLETQRLARVVERAARKLGVSDLIHLQRVRLNVAQPAATRPLALERASGVAR
jgi:hypothetical protein